MDFQYVFKRYEYKYLITQKQKDLFLVSMKDYIRADEYGQSTICNVYFDTPDYIIARQSIEKPIYKEKLRMRSYGKATKDQLIFIELKKKYQSVVYKRRICLREEEAMHYFGHYHLIEKHNQIALEIDYACQFYQNLLPMIYLSYQRTAYYAKNDPDLRITFDQHIIYRDYDISLCSTEDGQAILDENMVLMEIKVKDAIPLWLCHFLSEHHIYRTSFSKYGIAYQNIIKQKGVVYNV